MRNSLKIFYSFYSATSNISQSNHEIVVLWLVCEAYKNIFDWGRFLVQSFFLIAFDTDQLPICYSLNHSFVIAYSWNLQSIKQLFLARRLCRRFSCVDFRLHRQIRAARARRSSAPHAAVRVHRAVRLVRILERTHDLWTGQELHPLCLGQKWSVFCPFLLMVYECPKNLWEESMLFDFSIILRYS